MCKSVSCSRLQNTTNLDLALLPRTKQAFLRVHDDVTRLRLSADQFAEAELGREQRLVDEGGGRFLGHGKEGVFQHKRAFGEAGLSKR